MFNNDYPYSWKCSFVHFIKKFGLNLGPTSLTSYICKLFETIIKIFDFDFNMGLKFVIYF